MTRAKLVYTYEERSPLLWHQSPPGLFIGSAGHLRYQAGTLAETFDTYYVAVIWGKSGDIHIKTLDSEYLIRGNTVCLVDHGNRFNVEIKSREGEFLFFTLDGDDSQGLLASLNLWEGLFHAGPPPLGNIETMISQLADVSEQGTRVNLVGGLDLLNAIRKEHRKRIPHKLVMDAEAILRKNWQNPLFSMESIYDELQTNKVSISTQFKAVTGKTMLTYLQDIRVKAAVRCLQETSLNISEIAYNCGFRDASYFSRFIRKKTGKAPMDFR